MLKFACILLCLMKSSLIAVTLSSVFLGDAMALEELIIDVPPEEARTVIERNEMQYEEYRWYSYPDRIRIAKIDADLLQQPNTTISETPFSDVLSIGVKNIEIDGSKWIVKNNQGEQK